ncbi:MAG: HTH-type transcriptional activator IlvY [Desulfobulbus sp.]|nr:MAG: HTH-type transcriptional activator IlvY [Desulfobulbus sp.]RUM35267.1 MAG: HTH-type transcriptional activator IlvY [Desulfobulbus sp.]RUM40361.1 MAG: HTH-type transcriptional activator IlvY [Desulfobulbus sp.]
MDIRELHSFIHLADSLHFGRASRACNITPSALTRTIQRIEDEVGERLFVRDNRSVALTPAGEIFGEYARDVIRRQEQLQLQLAGGRRLGGTLSIYCSVTAAYSILPSLFRKFRSAHPGVHIKLQTGDAALALASLQNREVDITIAALPKKLPQRVEYHKLLQTPLVFIAPDIYQDTVCYRKGAIDWLNTPIIMPDRGLSRQRIDRWFADKKIIPNVYALVAGNEAIIAMVSLGCGVGVVPLLVLEQSPIQEQVRILALSPELTPFSIGVCIMKKKQRLPQLQAFWEIATARTEEKMFCRESD